MKQEILDNCFEAINEGGKATGFEVSEIIRKKQGKRVGMGYGTLYRALDKLVKQGKIQRHQKDKDGRFYYTTSTEK